MPDEIKAPAQPPRLHNCPGCGREVADSCLSCESLKAEVAHAPVEEVPAPEFVRSVFLPGATLDIDPVAEPEVPSTEPEAPAEDSDATR